MKVDISEPEGNFSLDNCLVECTERFLPPRFFIPCEEVIIIDGVECNKNRECTEEEYWKYAIERSAFHEIQDMG